MSDGVVTLTGHVSASLRQGPLRLIVIDGPDRGKSVDIKEGAVRVGKAPTSALVLTDGRVSRDHLLVTVTPTDVHVRDLGSKNGTYLAGAKVQEATIGVGATLQIGDTRLRLVSQLSQQAPSQATSYGALVGKSKAMRELYTTLDSVADTDVSVLIEAETGCGKELCARSIHDHSRRSNKPYIVCDLAGTAPTLLESELFGHEKGAFTGANNTRAGLFVEADGGTLFIDEVGELDVSLQPRLLRALEAKQVKPVGSASYRNVNVRFIAATNRNLREEITGGRFREDLFHRLAVIRVRIPPLRERKEDILDLIHALLGDAPIEVTSQALDVLMAYDWPGNVRELRNVLERATALIPPSGGELTPATLGFESLGSSGATSLDGKSFIEMRDRLIEEWERRALNELMERAEGNVSRAAREGGLDRAYLHRLLKRHNLGRWAR